MFLVVVITIWLLIHLYLSIRIIPPLRLKKPMLWLAWSVALALFLLFPATALLRTMHPVPFFYNTLFWISFIAAGYILLVLPFMAAKDLAGLLVRFVLALKSRLSDSGGGHPPKNPERRDFLTNALNLGVISVSGILSGVAIANARAFPAVTEVDVPVPGLKESLDGFRIAHITDTHISHSVRRSFMQGIVDAVNNLKPDLISFTGDMVDGLPQEMAWDVAPVAGLKAKHGVFFVTGNHEYYWDLDGWLNESRKNGMTVLINEHRVISHNGGTIMVAGVTDYSAGRNVPSHRSDPDKATTGAPDCDFRIMLAHQPRSAPGVARAGVDLQLSGHTHGGQFFPWNLVVPLFHPVALGLQRYNAMWVYVSRGSGYWGPPYRLGAPSEITLLTLRATSRKAAGV